MSFCGHTTLAAALALTALDWPATDLDAAFPARIG
nr:hypothetical protein [Nocardia flavorosea]